MRAVATLGQACISMPILPLPNSVQFKSFTFVVNRKLEASSALRCCLWFASLVQLEMNFLCTS